MDTLTFDGLEPVTFDVDQRRRTITGLVVPWDKIGRHADGQQWLFRRGSIVYGHAKYVRLNDEHDESQRLGRAVSAEDTDAGLVMTFSVSPGPAGDRALAVAADGSKSGLSIEVDIDTLDFSRDPALPGVRVVEMANLIATAHVRRPAFADSRIISVMASYEGVSMTCPTCGIVHAEGAQCPAAVEPVTVIDQAPTAVPAVTEAVTFSAEQFGQLLERVGTPPAVPAPRPVVNGNRPVATAVVTEPLPYRFSQAAGKTIFATDADHDFSTDVFAAINPNSSAEDRAVASARVNDMIKAAFAVTAANVAAVQPNRDRPDLWQPQMDYSSPLWDMINAGSTDGRKFDVPKYNSSSGLVAAATPGTEPAPGAMSVTSQTVTPTSVWGKVEIERQSWRQGGSPQFSGILWDQMMREYYEARETAVATFLNTLTAAADITITGSPAVPTNDNDQASAASLEAAIADLQFARGGNRFRAFAAHQALYRLLARVTDDAGRPLYPRLNPTNANGTAADLFASLNVAGTRVVPAWALGAAGGNASVNSWMFDPAKVLGWASAPERLDWNFGATVQTSNITQLAYVTVGIYGDLALANLDINGVRQVIFDQNTAA